MSGSSVWAGSLSEDLQACAAVQTDTVRLQCYDALAAADNDARPVAPTGTAAPVTTDTAPETSEFGKRPELPKTLSASISALRKLPHGRFEVTLDNGQVWREIQPSMRAKYAVGDKVTITRTGLGSHFMRVDGRSYKPKVTRIE